MAFALQGLSEKNLVGVHPDLVKVVRDCAENWNDETFTFGVNEGLRTASQQALDLSSGKSMTKNSRHLDGHAVDLVVLLPGNRPVWNWPLYYRLALQMKQASLRTKIPLTWGGCWDRELETLSNDLVAESTNYVIRAQAHGEKGFLDGPHYQLSWARYPSAG